MKFSKLIFFFIVFCHYGKAQGVFNGVLLSNEDSLSLPFIHIHLKETNQSAVTDKNGFFTFKLSKSIGLLYLQIKGLGIDTTILLKNSNHTEKIYVQRSTFQLTEAVIKGLTAKQVVEEAIRRIPENYAIANYAYYSFYREYQKVNGRFKNFIEANAVVMIKPFKEKKRLIAEEAFAIQNLRRTNFYWDIDDMKARNGFKELLEENPIYHLERSSFTPFIFERCSFHFDSSSAQEDYVISYLCSYSSDNHGFEHAAKDLFGESYETGKLIIDRASLAFKRVERNSFRNRNYNYPRLNNFLLSKNYTVEFAGGNFVAEFVPINNKWFLKALLYSYTNEFYLTKIYRKDYSITENFEWYVDSISRYVDETLVNKFYKTPALPYQPYTYDSAAWGNVPPFFFYSKDEVYKDLERFVPIEEQFRNNSNRNE